MLAGAVNLALLLCTFGHFWPQTPIWQWPKTPHLLTASEFSEVKSQQLRTAIYICLHPSFMHRLQISVIRYKQAYLWHHFMNLLSSFRWSLTLPLSRVLSNHVHKLPLDSLPDTFATSHNLSCAGSFKCDDFRWSAGWRL